MAKLPLRYPHAVSDEAAYCAYGDEEAATKFLEQVRWPSGPTCPRCRDSALSQLPDATGRRWCRHCRRRYNVRTGTLLAGGHAPLRAWAVGAVLTANGPFAVGPKALSRIDGVSPRAAITVANGIRSVCGSRVSPYDRAEQIVARIIEPPDDPIIAKRCEPSSRPDQSWIAELSEHQFTVPEGVERWLTPPKPPEKLAIKLQPHPRPGITESEVLVLAALRSYLGGADSGVVAEASGITRRSAQRALRCLEADGYVDSAVVDVPWKNRARRILRWKILQFGPFDDLRGYLPMMRRRQRSLFPETLPPDLWYLFWSGPDPADIRLPHDSLLVANRLLNGRLLDFDGQRWALRCLPVDALAAQAGVPGCSDHVEAAVQELLARGQAEQLDMGTK